MKISAAVVLAAAIGASAHPSNHGHRNAHRSVQARDFVMAKKPAPPPSSTTTPPPPATSSTTPSPAPAPPSSSAAPPSSSASPSPSPPGAYIPFCQDQKRATLAQIAYAGNTGSGGVYGCNMMTIPASSASLYEYTIEFVNQGNSQQKCFCWNKIGPDGGINGFFKSNNKALTFELAAHGQQTVAFDKNSQIGCSCHADPFPYTLVGAFASTWVEADFCNESNQQYSGFDASSIVAAAAGLDIPGLQVCGKGTCGNICSTIFAGGDGKNAFLGGMEALDGIGGNCGPGPLALTVTVDYSP